MAWDSPVTPSPFAPYTAGATTPPDDTALSQKSNMWDRLSLHKLGGWLRKDDDGDFVPSDMEKSPHDVDLSLDDEDQERVEEEQSGPSPSPRRPPRKVVPALPRPTTFQRQKSEQRDRLVPVELPPAERRALSADRRGEPNARRNISPPLDFASRSSVPDSLDQHVAPKSSPDFSGSRNSLLNYGNDEIESLPDGWLPPPPNPLSMNDELPPDNYASSEVDERMLQQEMDKNWILNLSMTFRDESQREKFFVTYAEQPNKWRRVTVSCDYRNTAPESLESDLKSLHYQRDKSARIYESIRDSLPAIQFYDTVTNLKLETSDGRLHVHVTEDMNEIISYPSISAIDHLQCPVVPESSVRFESHLSGFVYKVVVEGQIYIKKEIPGPEAVEEFLYETNTLSKLQGSSSVIEFRGVIVDDARERIVGLLINYARRGALVDMMYDLKSTRQMPWPRRERWAKQIVQGLSDIHESGFVQGDFTLSNIVIDSNDDAKIIDVNRRGCPVGWEPPEFAKLIESGQRIGIYIGVKSDLFQLGMVLWALAEQEDEPERQERPLMVTDVDAPQYFKDMVNLCLSDDPRGRLSAKELLQKFPDIDLDASRPTMDSGYAQSVSTHRSDKEYIDPDTAVGREDIDQFRFSRRAAPLDNPSTGDLSFANIMPPTEYQAGSSESYILPNRGRSPAGSRFQSRYLSPSRPTSSISFDDSELSNEIVSPPVGPEPRWEHVYVDGVTRLVHHGSAAFDDHDFAAQEQATVCLPTPPGETVDPFILDRPYPAEIQELADFQHVRPPVLAPLPYGDSLNIASFHDRVNLGQDGANDRLADLAQEAEAGRSEESVGPPRTQFCSPVHQDSGFDDRLTGSFHHDTNSAAAAPAQDANAEVARSEESAAEILPRTPFGPPIHQDSGFHEVSHDTFGLQLNSLKMAQDLERRPEKCRQSQQANGPDAMAGAEEMRRAREEPPGVRPVEVSSAAATVAAADMEKCQGPKAMAAEEPLRWSFSGVPQTATTATSGAAPPHSLIEDKTFEVGLDVGAAKQPRPERHPISTAAAAAGVASAAERARISPPRWDDYGV